MKVDLIKILHFSSPKNLIKETEASHRFTIRVSEENFSRTGEFLQMISKDKQPSF